MEFSNYRRRILWGLFRLLIVPPAIIFFSFHLLRIRLSMLGILLALLSVPSSVIVRSALISFFNDRSAKRLGVDPIPCVIGRLPGNIDIMLGMLKSFRNGYVMEGMTNLFEKHNTTILNTRVLWDDQIICIDEGVLKFMFVTAFDQFERGYWWHERMDTLLGDGIFNTYGALWKQNRAIVRPFFSRDRVSNFEMMERSADLALALLSKRSQSHTACDFQDLMSRFTLDNASEFLFNSCLNSLSRRLPEPGRVIAGPKGSLSIDKQNDFDAFTRAFEDIQVIITRRGQIGRMWPLYELSGDKTEAGIKVITQWLDPLVKRAIQDRAASRKAGITSSSDETSYLNYMAENADDVAHVRYELLNILIASRDSTAALLTFVVYFLALHPDVHSRLQEEILGRFGLTGKPTYENVKGLKYLDAVIKETLRLFPSSALLARASKDMPLALPSADGKGFYLPPRTQVVFSSLLVHRRRDLWGETCDDFKPERWYDSELLSKVAATPFMYFPFHGGPRSCLGQNFALNEAGYFIIRLLQRFDKFELAPEAQPEGTLPPAEWESGAGRRPVERVWPGASFTTYVKGGLWIKAQAR